MVIFAKLVAAKHGHYTVYVFKNLEDSTYIMCTKLPNWNAPEINVGDEGYLKYEEVMAGQEYFNSLMQSQEKYNYSNVYFHSFILSGKESKNQEIIL